MNGFEVKALKYYPDHEGVMVPYGNLHYQNKKVGEFRASSWGGPMQYNHSHKTISESEVRKKLSEIVELLGWDPFYDEFDLLMEELIAFKEMQTDFKKKAKEGKYLVLLSSDCSIDPLSEDPDLMEDVIYEVNVNITEEKEMEMHKELKEKYTGKKLTSFKTLDDFNIL